jgi:hypothetical protein
MSESLILNSFFFASPNNFSSLALSFYPASIVVIGFPSSLARYSPSLNSSVSDSELGFLTAFFFSILSVYQPSISYFFFSISSIISCSFFFFNSRCFYFAYSSIFKVSSRFISFIPSFLITLFVLES